MYSTFYVVETVWWVVFCVLIVDILFYNDIFLSFSLACWNLNPKKSKENSSWKNNINKIETSCFRCSNYKGSCITFHPEADFTRFNFYSCIRSMTHPKPGIRNPHLACINQGAICNFDSKSILVSCSSKDTLVISYIKRCVMQVANTQLVEKIQQIKEPIIWFIPRQINWKENHFCIRIA